MSQAEWDPSLETGNELVDSQHKEIFVLVNELHDSIVERRGREAQDEVLVRVMASVKDHFTDEEALMRSIHYPRLVEQMRLHREFRAEANRLSELYASGETRLPITLAVYLYDWFLTHVRTEDRRIVEFIRASEE